MMKSNFKNYLKLLINIWKVLKVMMIYSKVFPFPSTTVIILIKMKKMLNDAGYKVDFIVTVSSEDVMQISF